MELLDMILSRLNAEDDADFWTLAVPILLREATWDLEQAEFRGHACAQIGPCSHWLRPHQTRWTAAGGFAWPSGYEGPRYSRMSLPQLNWFALACWNHKTRQWLRVEEVATKKLLLFRAALPTRTMRHAQAAVHTAWLPTDPSRKRKKMMRPHGFRKIEGAWRYVTGVDSFC